MPPPSKNTDATAPAAVKGDANDERTGTRPGELQFGGLLFCTGFTRSRSLPSLPTYAALLGMSDDALQAWLLQRGLRIEQVCSMHATFAPKHCCQAAQQLLLTRCCHARARCAARRPRALPCDDARVRRRRAPRHAHCVLHELQRARSAERCTPASAGDLLLEQPPYASVVADDAPACDACGKVADAGAAALKRCTRCRAARYCSTECQARCVLSRTDAVTAQQSTDAAPRSCPRLHVQRAAWRGTHAAECAALAALWSSQRRRPPPSLRLMHRILLKRAAQSAPNAPPPPPWDSPALLAALRSHRADASQEALIAAAQMATLLAAYAGTARVSDADAADDASASAAAPADAWRIAVDVEETTELLLALSCNAHGVADAELRELGRGLFPLVATANHDCAPAAALTFRGLAAQLRCLRALPAGSEITIAYIDVVAPAAERRAALRAGYFFDCACARCAAAMARGGSAEDRALVSWFALEAWHLAFTDHALRFAGRARVRRVPRGAAGADRGRNLRRVRRACGAAVARGGCARRRICRN